MRAAVLTRFGGPDAVELRDVPDPFPGPGQARVRVLAAATNNTDLWTREGAYGADDDPDARSGWRGVVDFPRIQGADVVGVVDSVGEGADPALVGRRVLVDPATYADLDPAQAARRPGLEPELLGVLGSEYDGGFAELCVVDADHVHDVTGSPLTDAQLACLPIAYGTAVGMLERGEVREGETVLVTGASGGVGLAAVQLAVARGCRVVAQTSPGNEAVLREAGADAAIDRDGGTLFGHTPLSLDAVVDIVGGPAMSRLLPRLRPGGRWIVAGAVAGPVVELDLRRLYLHNRRLVGSTMHRPADFPTLVAAAVAGDVAPRVERTYALEHVHDAHAHLAGRTATGKIVVIPTRTDRHPSSGLRSGRGGCA
ncbi:zinc-binding dehydrogenase [Nocardioidaceae bacterium]|nr:zinc-binding dehydrogenase [Nocardioidaceae bacterium]